MKCSQLTRMALGLIATAGLVTNFAAAQELGGTAGKSALNKQIQQQVQGQVQSRVQEQVQQSLQAQLQSEVQGQVQQQVQSQLQGQVQQQLQAQVQGQMSSQAQLRADAVRAGIMAQQAIDNARHRADGIRGQTGDGVVAASAHAKTKINSIKGKPLGALMRRPDGLPNNSPEGRSSGLPQFKGKPLGALMRRPDGLPNYSLDEPLSDLTQFKGKPLGALMRRPDGLPNNSPGGPTGGLPRGFDESDVKIYDAVFGSFNPFRGNVEQESATESNVQVDAGTNNQIASEWKSDEGIVKASANVEVDLATRIDSAINQRRTEISVMRDHAVEASNEAWMEQAEQMEQVLNLFIESRAQAAANSSDRSSSEGTRQRGLPVDRSPNSTRINAEQNSQTQGTTGTTGGNN